MLSLTDRLTVPQVFFNEFHVGGADETMKFLHAWDRDKTGRTAKQIYDREIGSRADPSDARLAVPTDPPVEEAAAPPRPNKKTEVKLPVKDASSVSHLIERTDSVLNVTRELMVVLPANIMPYMITTYKDCFRGSEGISAIKNHFGFQSRLAALEFARYLQNEHKILHHVCNEHEIADTFHLYFRLQVYHTPDVLNSFRIWTERVDVANPLGVVKRCRKLMNQLEAHHTFTDGTMDYVSAKSDARFLEFDEAVCELQGLDLSVMDEKTKLAFCINVYNLMIKHAFIKIGLPSSNLTRSAFFNGVKYNLGGQLFSFSELENGILRSNSKAPYSLSKPFGRSDPRIKLICEKLDPRIHFALNCGANSCPPVKNFTAESIEEELRVVAQAFCEQDTSVAVDEDLNELHLCMIFSWYRSDFAESASSLPTRIISYLRGSKRLALARMLLSNKTITLRWMSYDWNTNASRKIDFDPSTLNPNEKLMSCWSKQ